MPKVYEKAYRKTDSILVDEKSMSVMLGMKEVIETARQKMLA